MEVDPAVKCNIISFFSEKSLSVKLHRIALMSNIMWWQIEKKPFVHVANITIINAQRDITPRFFQYHCAALARYSKRTIVSTNRYHKLP